MKGLYRKLSPIEQAVAKVGDTVTVSADALVDKPWHLSDVDFARTQAGRAMRQGEMRRASGPRPDTLPAVAVTPAKKRLAKSRANLATGGGRRLEVNLPAKAAEQLEEIKAADAHETDKGAIIALIAAQAARIARRKP